jgi:hypothetical protein
MPIRSNLSFKSEFPTCSICNEPVELETTKSNEIGEPIHEECYALELSLGKRASFHLSLSCVRLAHA